MNASTTARAHEAIASQPSFADDRQRYQAIATRDPRAEGRFVYSVITTGVYCRPTCAARLARPENVAFHASADDAERAGYRACKRCRPRDLPLAERRARTALDARAILDDATSAGAATAELSLEALAARVGASPHHVHRVFKEHVGMTPREYASARRLARAEHALRDGASVTRAMHDAGYASNGRFYESTGALGMAPSAIGKGGEGVSIRATTVRSRLGRVLVAATARGVCAIALGDADDALFAELRSRFPRARIEGADDRVRALAARVRSMIDARAVADDLPLDLVGTAFQQRVWRELRAIPAGETATYSEIARRVGAPKAVRAVGSACAKNPVAVVVPCHRVLREDGALGGYRWGLERKRQLLASEGAGARSERLR